MPKPIADAVLKAGLQPIQQTVLTQLGVRADRIRARSLVWFADDASCWLVRDFNRNGNVEIVSADRAVIAAAVNVLFG